MLCGGNANGAPGSRRFLMLPYSVVAQGSARCAVLTLAVARDAPPMSGPDPPPGGETRQQAEDRMPADVLFCSVLLPTILVVCALFAYFGIVGLDRTLSAFIGVSVGATGYAWIKHRLDVGSWLAVQVIVLFVGFAVLASVRLAGDRNAAPEASFLSELASSVEAAVVYVIICAAAAAVCTLVRRQRRRPSETI